MVEMYRSCLCQVGKEDEEKKRVVDCSNEATGHGLVPLLYSVTRGDQMADSSLPFQFAGQACP